MSTRSLSVQGRCSLFQLHLASQRKTPLHVTNGFPALHCSHSLTFQHLFQVSMLYHSINVDAGAACLVSS